MYEFLIVFTALYLGGLAQSICGFGSMLVAMPLLTLLFPLRYVAAMMALLALPISLYIFYHNRRGIDWKEAIRIIVGSLAGIPLGLWTLSNVDSTLIMKFVGGFVVLYALYALIFEARIQQRGGVHESNVFVSLFVGLCSGVLGGAFNTSGPPLILYGDWLHWPKERFRAILQGVFVVHGVLILGGHLAAGHIESTMFPYFLASAPGIALGLYTGHKVDGFIPPEKFRYAVLAMLIVLGSTLALR